MFFKQEVGDVISACVLNLQVVLRENQNRDNQICFGMKCDPAIVKKIVLGTLKGYFLSQFYLKIQSSTVTNFVHLLVDFEGHDFS